MSPEERPPLLLWAAGLAAAAAVGGWLLYWIFDEIGFLGDGFNLLGFAERAAHGDLWAELVDQSRSRSFIRPLGDLWWYAAVRFAGRDAHALLASNVFLHGTNAWLLGLLAYALWRDRTRAFVSAGLYLAWPPASRTVYTFSELSGILAVTFILLSVLCALGALRGRRPRLWSALSLVCLAGGLLSKETALAVPLAFAGLAWTEPGPRRRRWGLAAAALALCAFYWAMRVAWLGGAGGYVDAGGETEHFAILTPEALGSFLRKAPLYLWNPLTSDFGALARGAMLAGLAGPLVYGFLGATADKRRRIGLLLFWSLAFLTPTIAVAHLGDDGRLSSARYFYSSFFPVAALLPALLEGSAGTAFAGGALGLFIAVGGVEAVPWKEAHVESAAFARSFGETLAESTADEVLIFERYPPDDPVGYPGAAYDGLPLPCVLARRPELIPPGPSGRAIAEGEDLPEVWVAAEVRGERHLFTIRDRYAKAEWIGAERRVLAAERRPVRRLAWSRAQRAIAPVSAPPPGPEAAPAAVP